MSQLIEEILHIFSFPSCHVIGGDFYFFRFLFIYVKTHILTD